MESHQTDFKPFSVVIKHTKYVISPNYLLSASFSVCSRVHAWKSHHKLFSTFSFLIFIFVYFNITQSTVIFNLLFIIFHWHILENHTTGIITSFFFLYSFSLSHTYQTQHKLLPHLSEAYQNFKLYYFRYWEFSIVRLIVAFKPTTTPQP